MSNESTSRKQLYWFIISVVCIIALAVTVIFKSDALTALLGAMMGILGWIANATKPQAQRPDYEETPLDPVLTDDDDTPVETPLDPVLTDED